MISIRNLAVTYRHGSTEVKALDGLSLNIPKGEIFAITGPSGCGKSTLLHVLAGVLTEYEGEVLFDGKPLNPKSFSIGIVPQQYGLLPWKRVRENIVLPYTLRKEAIEMPEFESIVHTLRVRSPIRGRSPCRVGSPAGGAESHGPTGFFRCPGGTNGGLSPSRTSVSKPRCLPSTPRPGRGR